MQVNQRFTLGLLPFLVLCLAVVACGGFQLRPAGSPATATPTALPTATLEPTMVPPTAVVVPPSPPPTPTLQATAAPTVTSTVGLAPGGQAQVAASIVNVRADAKASATQVGQLTEGTVVTVTGGPVQADSYTWYQVDNGSGLTGWVASGPPDSPWLEPQASGTAAPTAAGLHLVDRAIKVGDMVQVTTQDGMLLTVRSDADTDADAVAKALPGTQFTVHDGPVQKDNFTWWEIEGDQYKGWAADGDGQTRWLTPLEH